MAGAANPAGHSPAPLARPARRTALEHVGRGRRLPSMARREEQIRELALAVIDDRGADAHYWTSLRAARFRKDGDHVRAELWDYVAALVLKIQGARERRTVH